MTDDDRAKFLVRLDESDKRVTEFEAGFIESQLRRFNPKHLQTGLLDCTGLFSSKQREVIDAMFDRYG